MSDGANVGYVFMCFALKSYNIPECPCEDSALSVSEQLVETRAANSYWSDLPASRWACIAFSQSAFKEILGSLSYAQKSKSSTGGAIYADAQWYLSARVTDVEVTANGLRLAFSFDSQGAVSAGVRAGCGGVTAASAKLRIEDTSPTVADLKFKRVHIHGVAIQSAADVDFGNFQVTLSTMPPIYPIDQVFNWLSSQLLNWTTSTFEPVINKMGSKVFILSDNDANLYLAKYSAFPRRSIVLMGEVGFWD